VKELKLVIKMIVIMTTKIICGIFIGAIILPLKLLESRVESKADIIEIDFGKDQL